MNAASLFPGKYLKAADLGGREAVLTIDGLTLEMVGSGDDVEEKPVLRFRERTQGLVLNKTNVAAIADVHGNETSEWEGKPIVLFPTRTQFGSKMVDCVRCRGVLPRDAAGAGAADAGSAVVPF